MSEELKDAWTGVPAPWIAFTNQGEIDLTAATILGVNVKEGASPIGFFGTGLKYAIATLLRNKQRIEIQSGLRSVLFSSRTKMIRGKPFEIIYMGEDGEPEILLGFTTDLGKRWSLSNAYRELWSNAKDEGGEVLSSEENGGSGAPPWAQAGQTQIIVHGEDFLNTHNNRWEFLLNRAARGTPLAQDSRIEIFSGASEQIFYKDIAALKLEKPSRFTYNIKCDQQLTEDRTLLGSFSIERYIKELLFESTNELLITSAVTAPESLYEGNFHYASYDKGLVKETFKNVVLNGHLEMTENLSKTALHMVMELVEDSEVKFKKADLTEHEATAFTAALELVASWGYDYDNAGYKVEVVETCGEYALGRAYNGRAWIARKALESADDLQMALVEEFVHLRYHVADETRQMQTQLLTEVIKQARARASAVHIAKNVPMSLSEPSEEDEVIF